MAYYRRIRELREDNDKTQKEVADYLQTPYQYYAVYEKGGSEISFERAIALANYYDVSLDYIAGRTNSKKGMSYGELTENEQILLNTFSKMNEEEKKKAAELLNTILAVIDDKK